MFGENIQLHVYEDTFEELSNNLLKEHKCFHL